MIIPGFWYTAEVFRADGTLDESQTETVHNLMPVEGLDHTIDVLLTGGTRFTSWYIGLFRGNYTPSSIDVMATFPTLATEATTQYSETTRQLFEPGTIASGAIDNSANKALFTATAAVTIYGGLMASSPTKAATTGPLISAVRFSSPKVLDSAGATLQVTAGFTFVSV